MNDAVGVVYPLIESVTEKHVMPFIIVSAISTKYNLLGHIGIYFYDKDNVIISILYQILHASHYSKCMPHPV